jgi:hypothetical protein
MIKNINNMEEKHYTPLFLINKMWEPLPFFLKYLVLNIYQDLFQILTRQKN